MTVAPAGLAVLARGDGSLANTILVVDDDKDFRRFMKTVLERAGYSTTEAATGEKRSRQRRGNGRPS